MSNDEVRQAVERALQPLVCELQELKKQREMPAQEWFSINQAAAYTGLSPGHIRTAVTGAMLPCSNVGTRDRPLYRISKTDLNQWLEKRKAGALPPPPRKRCEVKTLPKSRHLSSAAVA